MFDVFSIGFSQIFSVKVLLLILMGVVLGIIFGATPGISTSMGIALMLPLTFKMPLIPSIATILGLYVGGTSGGLITAILLNIPGTSSAIATCWDGHPMARRGDAGRALGIGILYSFFGGVISLVALFFMAPMLAKVALKFSSIEYFAISVFSLTLIASVSGKSLPKGITSATLGVIATTFGIAPVDSTYRYTFGFHQLDAGFQLLPVLIGVYAVAEILKVAEKNTPLPTLNAYKMHGFGVSPKEFGEQFGNMWRSALIGVGVGILPGIGGGISNIIAYTAAKNQSKHPEEYGTGCVGGIVASETANNAVTGGALIPLLTLGIPGAPATAFLLAALTVQGVIPGPLLFTTHINLVYAILAALLIANLLMVVVEYFGMKGFLQILKVPKHYLFPIVLVMCMVGAFSTNNRIFDVWSILVFALVGYALSKFGFPATPFVLGFILGGLFELNLRRSLIITDGSYWGFFTRPIAAVILLISVAFLAVLLYQRSKGEDVLTDDGI